MLNCGCNHWQGVDGWDVDLPTRLEASYICNLAAKLVWATWYIAVYGLRPIIIKPKPIGAHPAQEALVLAAVRTRLPFARVSSVAVELGSY